jgi:hypothetical protein
MTRRRHRFRRWLAAALIVAVLVSAGAIGLWQLTWMAPAWWAPLDPSDEQTAQLAERVEYRLAEGARSGSASTSRPTPERATWLPT